MSATSKHLASRFGIIAFFALACAGPGIGQQFGDNGSRPLDRYRAYSHLAAQRTEWSIRVELKAAERWMAKKDTTKAIDCLNKAKSIVDEDNSLSDARHQTLLRVIADRLRVAKAPADPKDDAALQKQAVAEEKHAATEQKRVADKKLQQQLTNIRALQKEGRSADARQLTKALAKQYPDRAEVRVAQRDADILDQLVSARQFRHEKARRYNAVMNDVERSALPPVGDIEFNVKYWKDRVQKRAKSNIKYTAKELAILRALNSPITAKFKNSRFQDVLDFLRTITNVPIIADPDSLKKAEIEDETPVTLNAKGLSLRTVLRYILTSHGLTYVVKDEVLEIVTQEKAKTMLTTRAYPVADLVHGFGFEGMVFGPQVANFQMMQNVSKLIDMIQTSVDPDSWKVNGGVGTIRFHAPTMSLIISNSAEVQAQIGTGGLLGR